MAVEYKASNKVSRQALVQAGLSTGQSAIYEALIHYGPQKATKIAFLAGVPRTLSYKILDELEGLGLVNKKDESGKVAVFTPAHPLKIKELAEKRLESAKEAKGLVEQVLPVLIKDFDVLLGTMPQAQLYAKVAQYAGKGGLEPLSKSERSDLEEALKGLLADLSANKP